MPSSLKQFEAIVRALNQQEPAKIPAIAPEPEPAPEAPPLHPFDLRNIHPSLPPKVKRLFDDGHFPEATFHAFKYLDKKVQAHAGSSETGFKLMMDAFSANSPKVQLTPMTNTSEIDEQKGYQFIFAGGVQAIRNPRGHEFTVVDDPDICLDHLSFVSMLLRRLEQAGFV